MMFGTCEPLRPVEQMAPPAFGMPDTACDAHMHVFGSIEKYPAALDRQYLQPNGDLAQYAAVAEHLGLTRSVLVQASYYGTDNSCILDAMEAMEGRSRGVVFLDADAPHKHIDALSRAGVRGLRLDFFKAVRQEMNDAEMVEMLRSGANRARAADWHLELYAPGKVIRLLTPYLAELPVDVSINHMGYLYADDSTAATGFERLLEQLSSGNIWIKLTAPYRMDKDQAKLTGIIDERARALIVAAPTRMLWGSDWPHVPTSSRDTGAILNRFASWCPDESVRRRILVENPAHMYGF